MNIYIGFDFSINKPACTILSDKNIKMFFWPINIQDKLAQTYKDLDINITDRGLDSVSKDKYDNHELVREHTRRSKELALMICKDLSDYIKEHIDSHNISDYNIYIASEGLSFNSKGSSYLDLATYKGVFLDRLSELYDLNNIFTFSPITIKATAGCNKGDKRGKKDAMIEAFMELEDSLVIKNKFHEALKSGILKNKVNYKTGVDDLVDSYFCAVTLKNFLEQTQLHKK